MMNCVGERYMNQVGNRKYSGRREEKIQVGEWKRFRSAREKDSGRRERGIIGIGRELYTGTEGSRCSQNITAEGTRMKWSGGDNKVRTANLTGGEGSDGKVRKQRGKKTTRQGRDDVKKQ